MLLETLDELVEQAGRLTLTYFHRGVEVELKEDQSPVTIADRLTEQFLREEILKRFPQDTVIGEEFGQSGTGASGRKWIIDPIDGTKSFISGVPLYGVMVGVEQDDQIIAGAIGLPALGEAVIAEKGRGAWHNQTQCHVRNNPTLGDAILLTTDIANIAKYGRKPAWDALTARTKYYRTWGDCYGHVLVATGRADIMFDPVMAVWDTAPLPIILAEAGGQFHDFLGTRAIRNNGAVTVTAALSDEVMHIVYEQLGPTGQKF